MGKRNISESMEFPVPASKRPKLTGFDFYTKTLGAPKLIVAPMVDQSELAWRLLSRRHGAHLCYTPMLHSQIFSIDQKYRDEALQSCPEDRPLIIQFCGNDAKTLLSAAKLAQDHCDAIDINLGCPQAIAKRGHYGAFLQDEWKLLHDIVSTLNENISVPVTCKIRRFDDINKTIEYAKMLESAGCQMLTVHGRTREQKGPLTGIADWNYIRAVRENVNIPVIANGNIMTMEDIERCIESTGALGVMTAEGNLFNPVLFEGQLPLVWDVAIEYLDLVEQYPCPNSYIRGHLFKLFYHLMSMKENHDARLAMATSHSIGDFRKVVLEIKEKYLPIHNGEVTVDNPWTDEDENTIRDYNLHIPPWLCHSRVRLPPADHLKKLADKEEEAKNPDRIKPKFFDNDGNEISRKHMKKLRRMNRRPIKPEGKHDRNNMLCQTCGNPVGIKCQLGMCKRCCRDKCYQDNLNCTGHKCFIGDKRLKAVTQIESSSS